MWEGKRRGTHRDSEAAVVKGTADAQYRALSDASVGGCVGCIDSLRDTFIQCVAAFVRVPRLI